VHDQNKLLAVREEVSLERSKSKSILQDDKSEDVEIENEGFD